MLALGTRRDALGCRLPQGGSPCSRRGLCEPRAACAGRHASCTPAFTPCYPYRPPRTGWGGVTAHPSWPPSLPRLQLGAPRAAGLARAGRRRARRRGRGPGICGSPNGHGVCAASQAKPAAVASRAGTASSCCCTAPLSYDARPRSYCEGDPSAWDTWLLGHLVPFAAANTLSQRPLPLSGAPTAPWAHQGRAPRYGSALCLRLDLELARCAQCWA